MEGINTSGLSHSTGEFVVYRNNGIYKIADIRKESFCGIGEHTYYVMCSVYDNNSIIYVPVDAKDIETNLRLILTPQEIDTVILKAETLDNIWKEDVKERAEYFDGLLSGGESADILWLFKILTAYKSEIENGRKKLYASDARILSAAEKIITDEFSFVLGIEKNDVIPYIIEKTQDKNKS